MKQTELAWYHILRYLDLLYRNLGDALKAILKPF